MNLIFALLGGIAGACASFLLGVGIGALLASTLGISSFEGASGYFTIAIGLIGGVIGLIAGIVLVLRIKGGYRRPGAILGRTALVLGGLAALVFIGIQIRLATLEHFPGNIVPQLHFEIRLPTGASEPQRRGIDFEMQAGSQRSGGQFKDPWLRRDGERYVLSGFVPLYTRTSRRILVVTPSPASRSCCSASGSHRRRAAPPTSAHGSG